MIPGPVDRWLGDREAAWIVDEASITMARSRVRRAGQEAGLPAQGVEELVIIASELAWNQVRHAMRGWLSCEIIQRDGIPGVELLAADRGPGIADPAGALRGGKGSGLGQGLAAAHRLADELDFDIRYRQGSAVWARKFARRPRITHQVAVISLPHPEETSACGDDAIFVRTDQGLLLAVFDGLGHGPDAAVASGLAAEHVLARPLGPLDAMMADLHDVLRPSRGAAGALVRMRHDLEHVCLGNVATQVHVPGQRPRSLPCGAGIIGRKQGPARVERVEHGGFGTVVLTTDGLDSRSGPLRGMEQAHPLFLAGQVFQRQLRGTDDALVLVARRAATIIP